MNTLPNDDEQLRAAMRERYGQAALQVLGSAEPTTASCCDSSCCGSNSICCSTETGGVVTHDLYSQAELGELPVAAALASLGCGNPTALAELKPGEKVLDLGSGGGIDGFVFACRGGARGFSFCLDIADGKLRIPERNPASARVDEQRL